MTTTRTIFYAVVDCREGMQYRDDGRGPCWEPRYTPVSLAAFNTEAEAGAYAIRACVLSPRDCIRPRVRTEVRSVET